MIYVAQAEGTNFVKIGYTESDPIGRVASLQVGCPHRLVLICALIGDPSDEVRIHEKFARFAERGEWFRLEPDVVGWIADNWAFRVANQVGAVRLGFDSVSVIKGNTLPPSVKSQQGKNSKNVLRFLQGVYPDVCTPAEIASRMHNPPGHVRTYVRRLLRGRLIERVGCGYRAMRAAGHSEGGA